MREMKLQDAGENCIMLNFLLCTACKLRHTSWLGHVVHRRDHKLMLGFGHITWREDMT